MFQTPAAFRFEPQKQSALLLNKLYSPSCARPTNSQALVKEESDMKSRSGSERGREGATHTFRVIWSTVPCLHSTGGFNGFTSSLA